MSEREVKEQQEYRHFKGNHYKVLHIAYDSETTEEVVVYEALYDDHKIWVRPYTSFNSLVDKEKYPDVEQKYRFELIEK